MGKERRRKERRRNRTERQVTQETWTDRRTSGGPNLQVDVDASRLGVETEARINNVAEGKQDADCALHKRAGWSRTNSFILRFAPRAECTQDFPS